MIQCVRNNPLFRDERKNFFANGLQLFPTHFYFGQVHYNIFFSRIILQASSFIYYLVFNSISLVVCSINRLWFVVLKVFIRFSSSSFFFSLISFLFLNLIHMPISDESTLKKHGPFFFENFHYFWQAYNF